MKSIGRKTTRRIELDKEIIADLEATDTDAIKGGRSSGGSGGTFVDRSSGGTSGTF